jgi:hypothetical protein
MGIRLPLAAWFAVVATGCCFETTSGRSFDTSSGGSGTGSGTGGVAGASSSSAGSSGTSSTGTGTTGFSGPFLGSIAVERLASEDDPDGGITTLQGQFVMASDWPTCTPDTLLFDSGKVSCCFQPSGAAPLTPSAGTLKVLVPLDDGGVSSLWVSPLLGGTYDGQVPSGPWFSGLAASGGDVPAFEIDALGLQGPTPALTPPLAALTSLSTTQEWNVPLTPSELEYSFRDTVELEADGVGSVYCVTFDEGALSPPLVVPAGMLANLAGHSGTVTVTRDDYRGLMDAGPQVQLGFRVGVRVQTAVGGVAFAP